MKYYLFTIGCQMNVSDSERIATVLEKVGYQRTAKESEADLICVMACSVRQKAIDRIYGQIKNWSSQRPKPFLILTGCLLEEDKKKLNKHFDLIFEIKNLPILPQLIFQNMTEKFCHIEAKKALYLEKNYLKIVPKYQSSFQAYVPIMTGCNNFCTYCVVPYTRGREISRPQEEIICEVKNLVKRGYKEIILLGQNVNSYCCKIKDQKLKIKNTNQKEKNIDFPKLLRIINDLPGNFWIRFLTSHPKDMSDELIKTIAQCKKVTEYVHLPVQSGNDEILKKMNRGYTIRDYSSKIRLIREKLPEGAISTDIIVGFPTESEAQFEKTKKLMEKVGFDMAYLAQYSPRPGTRAYQLKDDIPKEEKEKREKILNEILKKTALENNKKLIGKTVEVLVEDFKKRKNLATLSGRTRTFKPIQFNGPKSLIGQFVKVKITDCTPWGLKGRLVK